MLDLAKKAVLVGTGMALAATDRIQEVVDQIAEKGTKAGTETRETIAALARKTRKTRKTVEEEAEKVLTDFTAFWYYTSLTDEMEDRVEKMVSLIMKKLHIPERQELEEIKARIEKLEKECFE
ncbi:MAG: phasin family protein [Syntrophobacterales bacterium]|nr:phasin family protein [Syntrophobacterales bacterium]